mmetsp:Transcript_9886/g.16475  ORF Transcript_9886/g.16475 Transcript_9886/m.16475 type:complete len:89 (+) Transcript_9886:3-269(+)
MNFAGSAGRKAGLSASNEVKDSPKQGTLQTRLPIQTHRAAPDEGQDLAASHKGNIGRLATWGVVQHPALPHNRNVSGKLSIESVTKLH